MRRQSANGFTVLVVIAGLVAGLVLGVGFGHFGSALAQPPSRGTVKSGGVNQGDLVRVLRALRNRAFNKASLAQATTPTQIKTTNTVDYMIDGVIYRKTATDNLSIASLTATGASQISRVRVEINASGTVSFAQGPVQAVGLVKIAGGRSAGKATLGYFDMGASFTPATTTTNNLTFFDGDPDLDAIGLES